VSFEEQPLRRDPEALSRDGSLLANSWLVARRELRERVRSRLYHVSTGLLAVLAIVVSLTPVLIKVVDRGSTTTIAVVSADDHLAQSSISILNSFINPAPPPGQPPAYSFIDVHGASTIEGDVADGRYDGALLATRQPDGQIAFQFLVGERIGADRLQVMQVGILAVGVFDWTERNRGNGTAAWIPPSFQSSQVAGGGAAGQPIGASEYAGRRIVGVVFVVLIFITLVIYGMWVAAGVVAEKSSRVMELLVSAASPAELVIGKVAGIGLAGLIQYVAILLPALVTLLLQDRIASLMLGSASGVDVSIGALTPGLLAAYAAYWVLGFLLYALIYAAAGSLVSRAEDLQVLALPLSIIAIGGYIQAVMALSGGISSFIRLSSYVPFWSPFVMLTRLTIGRVEPWELALSFGLLVISIPIVGFLAIRVYSAGVLLYGQRPGARQIVGAIVSPPA
jgi:ABC-2 type transport system permease protein